MMASSPNYYLVAINLFALFVLAATSGFLVGQASNNANLLAAVLPLVIAGGGAAALGLNYRDGAPASLPPFTQFFAACGVIVFSVAFLLGSHVGVSYKDWTQEDSRARALKLQEDSHARALRLHAERLYDCGILEVRTNDTRQKLGLEPLPTSAFCPIVLPE